VTHIQVSLSRKSKGGLTFFTHNEDKNTNIFDWANRECAGGGDGCPAVMLIKDESDTFFTKEWQFFLWAINLGMSKSNVSNLMSKGTALMNRTGVGEDGRANYITGENLSADDPHLDKFRTFARNTHAAVYENGLWRLITMDGNNPPPLNPGYTTQPRILNEVNLLAYKYTPQTHPYLFLVCNNVQLKQGGVTSVFPFAHGLVRPWLDEDPYSFFPFVSVRPQFIEPQNINNWTRLEDGQPFPSPYRRV
jgi:hypothetical protein